MKAMEYFQNGGGEKKTQKVLNGKKNECEKTRFLRVILVRLPSRTFFLLPCFFAVAERVYDDVYVPDPFAAFPR